MTNIVYSDCINRLSFLITYLIMFSMLLRFLDFQCKKVYNIHLKFMLPADLGHFTNRHNFITNWAREVWSKQHFSS